MKRVRWNNGELQYDDGPGSVLCSDPGEMFETDYRGFEWREVERTEYVPETGAIRLVLKAVKNMVDIQLPSSGQLRIYGFLDDGRFGCAEVGVNHPLWRAFFETRTRTAHVRQISPSVATKYTDEAVDELIDSLIAGNAWLTRDEWRPGWCDSTIRQANAFQSLLKQRESAHA